MPLRHSLPSSAVVAETAVVSENVSCGQFVVLHEQVLLASGCTVQDRAVIGKPALLGKKSTAAPAGPLATSLGHNVAICSGAVVFAGTSIGEDCIVGDQAIIRERVAIGSDCVIGAAVVIENDVVIGNGVKIQTGAYITAHSLIEDDVFVAPRVVTTNDNTMGRHGPDTANRGAIFRHACRVGAAAVILPGIEIGAEAFVAAGAVVTRDVAPAMLVVGSPARELRDVPDEDRIQFWR
ncbi:MAG: N-acetyltransferase [Thermoleophilaceae bacterium]|nr:N-acetyltransferase [Thermoleophilaceae bacterium]